MINQGGINACYKDEILIERTKMYNNATALMIASSFNHYTIAKALIDNGALVNLRASDVYNALMEAVKADNIEIAKLLIEHDADLSVKNKNGETMLMIACNNANINEKSDWGANCLIYASEGGNISIMKYLIENGNRC